MARSLSASRWYIPLVASTEVARRSGDLAIYDPGNSVGTLPDGPVYPYSDSILWYDSALVSSVFATAGSIYRVRDRSGFENNATQGVPAQQPQDDEPGFNLTD